MNQRAFTLIELMITVAIVAILASVALPSYKNYTMRGNRTDGIESLQALLDAQERYYADNMEYTDDLKNLGAAASEITTSRGFYKIKADKCKDFSSLSQCVRLYATAQGIQQEDGDLIFNTAGKQVRMLNGSEYDL